MYCLFPCSATDKTFALERFSQLDDTIISDLEPYINNNHLQNVKQALFNDHLFKPDGIHDKIPLKVPCMPMFSSPEVEVIGSSSEGLSVTENSEAGINEEIDITAILKTIKGSESSTFYLQKDFVEIIHVSNFPGHVYLKLHHPETISEWNGLCNIISNMDGTITEFYISPVGFTDELYLMNCYRECVENLANIIDMKDQNDAVSPMEEFSPDEDSSELSNQNSLDPLFSMRLLNRVSLITQEGPAIKFSTLQRKDKMTLQVDCAFAIWCQDWPKIAKPWIGRQRKSGWPSPSTINEITQRGCLLVPKSPLTTRTNLEWRLSFCLVERDLINTLNEDQKLCYKVLKCIWRRFLKPPAGKALQSYHLKTVFLWECEDIAKEDWGREKTVRRVMGLLQRLETYLVYEYCPQYIIPENNLFSDIDKAVLFRATQRVQTAIVRADVVWINNTGLTFLEPNKTRIGMEKGIQVVYVEIMEQLLQKYKLSSGINDDHDFETKMLEKIGKLLTDVVDENISQFVVEYLRKSLAVNEDNLARRYICSRALPKDLEKVNKIYILELLAVLMSSMMAWGDMIELMTNLETLKSSNFKEFGFPNDFTLKETVRLLLEYGLQPGLSSNSDCEWSDTEEEENILLDEGFDCDICDKRITDLRFHCNECPDFDMCSDCFDKNTYHPHELVEIDTDDTSPPECNTQ